MGPSCSGVVKELGRVSPAPAMLPAVPASEAYQGLQVSCESLTRKIWRALRRVPEEVPEEAAQLMNECMAYDPKERPSAKEIYARLSAVQTSSEASSTTAGSKGGSSGKSAAQQSVVRSEGEPGLPGVQGQDEETYRDLHRELEATEVRQKAPTPLGNTRLPVRSAFDMSE